MGLFHKHDYPRTNYSEVTQVRDEHGNLFVTGTVDREVRVGDDWSCGGCDKKFFVFTMEYGRDGTETPVWREVGKFK